MTDRDRLALGFLLTGATLSVVVAGAYGGWRAACAVLAVLLLVVGGALAVGDEPTVTTIDEEA